MLYMSSISNLKEKFTFQINVIKLNFSNNNDLKNRSF